MDKKQGFIKTTDSAHQNFKVNSKERIISGYFTTNHPDRMSEVALPSAFLKTMETYMGNPVVTFMHDIRNVIGKVVDYKIDEKGVWVKAQIAKGVKWADEVWSLIEQGMIKAFSFGYSTIDEEKGELDGKEVNFLKEVDLYEIAVVSVPMNANALFSLSKSGAIKSISLSGLADISFKDEILEIPEIKEEVVESKSEKEVESTNLKTEVGEVDINEIAEAVAVKVLEKLAEQETQKQETIAKAEAEIAKVEAEAAKAEAEKIVAENLKQEEEIKKAREVLSDLRTVISGLTKKEE